MGGLVPHLVVLLVLIQGGSLTAGASASHLSEARLRVHTGTHALSPCQHPCVHRNWLWMMPTQLFHVLALGSAQLRACELDLRLGQWFSGLRVRSLEPQGLLGAS